MNQEVNYSTTLGNLNENLRKYLKGSYIENIEQINEDRVVKFSLTKTNEFYQKDRYSLIIELIPTINNLVITDENDVIVFAKHYQDLSSSRAVLKGMKYIEIEKNPNLHKLDFDFEKYNKEVNQYLLEIDSKRQIEKAGPLFNFIKQKVKSLNKKIKVLENEKNEAEKKLCYKEIGDNLLTYKYDEVELSKFILNLSDYDSSISVEENAHKYYEKYKKNKRTIEHDVEEIEIAKNQLNEFEHILSLFSYYSVEEIEELYKKYLPQKLSKKEKEKVIDARLPYYVEYMGERIGFGKNKEQNNYLTFKKANKTDIYLHVSNTHGAHVVIFNSDPKKEVIEAASHIALILSNLEEGDVYIADIKDVKKGNSLGEALVNNYQTITIHKIKDEYKSLLKKQKRFGK